jgi:para-aminobenzoate synthetase component 1
MRLDEFRQRLNEWGRDRVPFLFVVDFEMEKPQVWRMNELDDDVLFDFNGKGNGIQQVSTNTIPPSLQVNPIPFEDFKVKFDNVMHHLNRGDSYVTNLTIKSKIESKIDLQALFFQAKAKYKLWLKDQFLFFSPEIFVQIENGVVKTFPMKGTIDATVPDAANKILSDTKELAEHVTIVDLLRNDLGLVAKEVEVKRFRYIEEIKTSGKNILQVSSEISGKLPVDYLSRLGDIMTQLLPAGSISGAPKKKTVEIIQETEQEPRGYYTGVAGYFDGERLDSCVMIRFIEQVGNQFYYRSGAGLTAQSKVELEYQEILDKIYVPVD